MNMQQTWQAVVLWCGVSACVFQPEFATDAQVQLVCISSNDCPATWNCERGRCQARGADALAPQLLNIVVPPYARADEPLVVTVTADEPLAVAPVLHFGAGHFAVDSVSALAVPTVDLALTPSSTAADGRYTLQEVTLEDAAGNRATYSATATVVLDRSPPEIGSLLVEPQLLSHVEGYDQFRVSFMSDAAFDQPGENVVVTVGGTPLPCRASPSARGVAFVCDGDVAAEMTGSVPILVAARDVAGNVRLDATGITVDDAPISIDVPVLAARTLGSDVDVQYLSSAGTVRITLVSNKAVSLALWLVPSSTSADVAHLLATEAVPSGTSELTAVVPHDLNAGAYGVQLVVFDEVGHSATINLDPMSVQRFEAPRCDAHDAAGVPGCVDEDGDGVFGRSAACAMGLDCDDQDALRSPFASPLPGYGRGTTCQAQAAPQVSDDNGIFVAVDGNDAHDGSSTAPVATVGMGMALAGIYGRPYVFVRPGAFVIGETPFDAGVALIGVDAADTPRPAQHPVVTLDQSFLPSFGSMLVWGVTLVANQLSDIRVGGFVAVDAELVGEGEFPLLYVDAADGSARFYRVRAVQAYVSAHDVLLNEVNMRSSIVVANGTTRVHRSSLVDTDLAANGALRIVGSHLTNSDLVSSDWRAVHSTLVGHHGFAGSDTARVDVISSILVGETLVERAPVIATLVGSTILLQRLTDAVALGAVDPNACADQGCVGSFGNNTIDPLFAADGLTPTAPALVGTGVEALSQGDADGAVDLVGNCRAHPPTPGAIEPQL